MVICAYSAFLIMNSLVKGDEARGYHRPRHVTCEISLTSPPQLCILFSMDH